MLTDATLLRQVWGLFGGGDSQPVRTCFGAPRFTSSRPCSLELEPRCVAMVARYCGLRSSARPPALRVSAVQLAARGYGIRRRSAIRTCRDSAQTSGTGPSSRVTAFCVRYLRFVFEDEWGAPGHSRRLPGSPTLSRTRLAITPKPIGGATEQESRVLTLHRPPIGARLGPQAA